MEDAVTLNARHFIQMWQHLKRALEEFAQIKLKSMFMPRGCRVLHLKIRRPIRAEGRLIYDFKCKTLFAGGSWDVGLNPDVVTSSLFFSFIFFLPFGFLLFILTADPVSFARFLRKRISSLI